VALRSLTCLIRPTDKQERKRSERGKGAPAGSEKSVDPKGRRSGMVSCSSKRDYGKGGSQDAEKERREGGVRHGVRKKRNIGVNPAYDHRRFPATPGKTEGESSEKRR